MHFNLAYERYQLRCEGQSNLTTLVNIEDDHTKTHSYYKQSSFLNHHHTGPLKVGDHLPSSKLTELKENKSTSTNQLLGQPFTLWIGSNEDNQRIIHTNICEKRFYDDNGDLYKSLQKNIKYDIDAFGYVAHVHRKINAKQNCDL